MPTSEDLFHSCASQRSIARVMFADADRSRKEAIAMTARALEMMQHAAAARALAAQHRAA